MIVGAQKTSSNANQSSLGSPQGPGLHELFEAQVRRSPDAPAVTFAGANLTYGQINERANHLARRLRACGVGPEIPVALFIERSPDMVVAILAVLKAGGFYVPIDMACPRDRADFILRDIHAPVLLTQEALRDRLPAVDGQVLCFDSDSSRLAGPASANLPSETNGQNAAYIIYTSGSTGKIKGVVVTHDNVSRLFTRTEQWFGFGPSDVWTLFHSYAFDFSVWELWGALLYGGRLVVVPHAVARSPRSFLDLLFEQKVTVLNQTPSAFRQLIWTEAAAEPKRDLSLRYVICGGEALELQSLKPWFDRHGDDKPAIVNMYGITETTVHVTYRVIRKTDLDEGLGSVIGVPIPDLQLHLLDNDLKPVLDGVPGEICIGGAGVARGYWNRPDLTRDRFVPDPFLDTPGARLYRSGDLAQRSASGELEYLGRLDHQVKIRGFRIELGEIESLLNRHPAVRESVVVAHEPVSGDKRLAAYIVPANGEPNISQLRSYLAQTIPDYMIPASFVFLESLPLTTNGKVNRRSLPRPPSVRPSLSREYRAPESDAEKILAKIWRDVLEMDQVGVDDNFFELGGDSIRSVVILSKAQRRGVNLSMEQLFAHPTIAELAPLASPNGLLVARPEQTMPSAFALLPDVDRANLPAKVQDAYPMTRLQLGMFFHTEFNPDSAVYHDVFSFRIHAPFELAQLELAASRLIERHAILRTSFHLAGFSEPMQLVHCGAHASFTAQDIRALAAERQENEIKAWIAAERHKSFDRAIAPLVRFHVQRLTDDSFQFFISFHHACLDGWSLAAVITELFTDYRALLHGNHSGIPPLSCAYQDFVALEREAIASESSRRFWLQNLQSAALQLLPRWPKSFRAGGSEQVRGPEVFVGADILQMLQKLAGQSGVPLKSILLAAHQRVMASLYGGTDVTSGLAFNGRPEAVDADRLPGLFLNTIPLRMQLTGGTWRELIQQSFAAEQKLIPHRRFPLSEIQKLQGGRPLFEAGFDFVHFHVFRNLQQPDFRFEESHYAEANDLTFFANFLLDVTSTRLELHIDYDPNELCREQIEQITRYYMNTLAEIAARPDGRYETFSPLSESERRRFLVEWNATQSNYPRSRCIHEIFEQRAAQSPDAPALVSGDQHLTHSELNAHANRLAHFLLRQAPLHSDIPVALCLNSPIDIIVATLAILKTGACYVPLDPSYPGQRLAFMLKDTQAPLLITERALLSRLPDAGAKCICLEDNVGEIEFESPENLSVDASPENLAYVMYTSGSTGEPRGVAVPHRAVNRLVLSTNYIQLGSSDRIAQVSNFSFDAATFEIWGALLNGGQLVCIHKDVLLSPKDFVCALREQGITALFLTTALFNQIVADMPEAFATVSTLLVGGEVLDPKSVRAALKQNPPRRFIHAYGPTENTTFTCCFHARCPGADATNVPIGSPIANTQVFILDSHLNPVPIGVAGELFTGGDGLARGYWNRAELTSEKFIPNPFSQSGKTELLYRTGDFASYLPDGNIQFIGRTDGQVKLRGFRIELGEIEHALNRHPAIRESVVIVDESASQEKRLIAYVVREGDEPSLEEIREFLARRLPGYMLPSAIIPMKSFPLTPNGKLDRRALPPPGEMRASSRSEPVAPRDDLESSLVEIWQDLLHVRPIGVADNFFHMGGHSLLAVRFSAQIERTFGKKLPLATLYQFPTIQELAPALRDAQIGIDSGSSIVPIQTEGVRPPLFLVHGAGGGMFWGYLNLARQFGAGQPVYGFRSRGLDGRPEFATIEELARSYVADLRAFQPHGPYYLGGYCFGGNVAHEMARQLSEDGEEVAFLALLNCVPPNSSFFRARWTPLWLLRFTRNLFYWLKCMVDWTPGQRREFFRWKMALLKKRIVRMGVSDDAKPGQIEPGDLVDLSSFSPAQRQLWETHIRALTTFHPESFPGRVHLFRSRGYPFWCSFASDYGWSGLAEAGVSVSIVPGAHEQILEEPYVETLARELQRELQHQSAAFTPLQRAKNRAPSRLTALPGATWNSRDLAADIPFVAAGRDGSQPALTPGQGESQPESKDQQP